MRTEENLSAVVAALASNCGDLFDACRQVGLSPIFVRTWMRDDAKVAERITEATQVGALRLESVAIDRAVNGIKKGIYYKGERVDTEQQYSDGLLQTVLKARLPQYAKDAEGGNTFNGPTQINIMPRAENYDEWLRMKSLTLAQRKRDETPALPPPDDGVIDAEFTSVKASPFEGLGI